MTVTINVNGLSLVHAGSDGFAMASLPNVCFVPSPSGPSPIPFPNVAKSSDLRSGSVTVSADGGHSIATRGSALSASKGDEAGVGGGIVSATHGGRAEWLTTSPNVFVEGQPVARLTDKLLCNDGNTACLGGFIQIVIDALFRTADLLASQPSSMVPLGLQMVCEAICACARKSEPWSGIDPSLFVDAKGANLYGRCVETLLTMFDVALGGSSFLKAEVPYFLRANPPVPMGYRDYPGRLPGWQPMSGELAPGSIVNWIDNWGQAELGGLFPNEQPPKSVPVRGSGRGRAGSPRANRASQVTTRHGRHERWVINGGTFQYRKVDVVILNGFGLDPVRGNVGALVEIKFKKSKDKFQLGQEGALKELAEELNAPLYLLDEATCNCPDFDRTTSTTSAPAYTRQFLRSVRANQLRFDALAPAHLHPSLTGSADAEGGRALSDVFPSPTTIGALLLLGGVVLGATLVVRRLLPIPIEEPATGWSGVFGRRAPEST